MYSFLSAFVGLSAGVVIGSAAAAFFTLLNFISRTIQVANARKMVKIYQNIIALGASAYSFIYFSNITFKLNNMISALVSLFMGYFLGMFSSTLAEVLDVIPILSKKLKTKHRLKYITTSLLFGKTLGSLCYWLIYVKR